MKHLLAIVLFFVACSPPGPQIDPAEHQTYLIYDYDPDDQEYRLHESEIRTFTNPQTIDGEVAFLRGGGSLATTVAEPTTRAEFENAIEVQNDHEPSAEYVIDDGVVVPFDFDTQMMVTLYHHLERAAGYFESLGFDIGRIGRMPVYYFPQVSVLGISLPLLSDNAAYAFTLDAFLIPPTLVLDEDVPLSANRGVVVHEYAHAVFNRIVHDDQRVPDFVWEPDWSVDAQTQIRSLDEGLADLFAGLAVQDPNFIGPSISAELFEIDRDLTIERIWDSDLQDRIDDSEVAQQQNPYLLGSVIASALWANREFLDDQTLAQTTLAAMAAIRSPAADFRVTQFFNAFLSEMPQEHRDAACDIFTERLELADDELQCGDAQ